MQVERCDIDVLVLNNQGVPPKVLLSFLASCGKHDLASMLHKCNSRTEHMPACVANMNGHLQLNRLMKLITCSR